MPKESILEEVATIIRGVVQEEWIQTAPITMESTFAEDLELESIEIVALAEQVQGRFGTDIDFAGWLSEMDLDGIVALTVGQLVDRIAERTAGAA
ncbi:MAG: acyl carrier protein [Dehalococcoidia bacterium]